MRTARLARRPWPPQVVRAALVIAASAWAVQGIAAAQDRPCSECRRDQLVKSRNALVSTCICGPGFAATECHATRFALDIDGNGIEEEFVGIREAMGNAGGEYFVFKQAGDAHRCLGSIFLHPMAVKAGGGDPPTLIVYWRLGADEGLLRTVTLGGEGFRVTAERTIKPLTEDASLYDELFSVKGRP